MSELFPSTNALEDLSGMTEAATGVYYPAKGEGLDWYASFAKCIYRLVRNLLPLTGLRVYKSAKLACGIKAGKFFDGNTPRQFAGTEGVNLTDNATNYIYMLTDATVQVNTSGFPAAGTTRHIRLATIQTANGTYSDENITDYRTSHLWQVAGPVPNPAAGSVGPGELADAVADLVPKVQITVGAESGNTIQVSVQIRDCQDNANANRFLVRAWLASAPYGAEAASAPNGGVAIGTGTLLQTITTGKHWTVISDSSGLVRFDVTDSGAPTFYLNVELDGRVYTGTAIKFSA